MLLNHDETPQPHIVVRAFSTQEIPLEQPIAGPSRIRTRTSPRTHTRESDSSSGNLFSIDSRRAHSTLHSPPPHDGLQVEAESEYQEESIPSSVAFHRMFIPIDEGPTNQHSLTKPTDDHLPLGKEPKTTIVSSPKPLLSVTQNPTPQKQIDSPNKQISQKTLSRLSSPPSSKRKHSRESSTSCSPNRKRLALTRRKSPAGKATWVTEPDSFSEPVRIPFVRPLAPAERLANIISNPLPKKRLQESQSDQIDELESKADERDSFNSRTSRRMGLMKTVVNGEAEEEIEGEKERGESTRISKRDESAKSQGGPNQRGFLHFPASTSASSPVLSLFSSPVHFGTSQGTEPSQLIATQFATLPSQSDLSPPEPGPSVPHEDFPIVPSFTPDKSVPSTAPIRVATARRLRRVNGKEPSTSLPLRLLRPVNQEAGPSSSTSETAARRKGVRPSLHDTPVLDGLQETFVEQRTSQPLEDLQATFIEPNPHLPVASELASPSTDKRIPLERIPASKSPALVPPIIPHDKSRYRPLPPPEHNTVPIKRQARQKPPLPSSPAKSDTSWSSGTTEPPDESYRPKKVSLQGKASKRSLKPKIPVQKLKVPTRPTKPQTKASRIMSKISCTVKAPTSSNVRQSRASTRTASVAPSSDVFTGLTFVITTKEHKSVQTTIADKIKAHGGRVMENWTDLYAINKFGSAFSSSLNSTPFVILIGETVMTPKFLTALARGIPILSKKFIEDAIVTPQANWRSYLSLAGRSETLGTMTCQLIDPHWGGPNWDPSKAVRVYKPFEGKTVLFVQATKSKMIELKTFVPFCLHAMGASRYDTTTSVPSIPVMNTWDYVLVEDRDKGVDVPDLAKASGKVGNLNWFKQCLINNALLPPTLHQEK
ncbi:hypothetical protein M231_00448 [Tremella mesenterica]|uniref:BRCT domain-containing protein n=1 Tax=Tremella mesenterica TaxID=5217 RepID=A0A4Q1BVC9_TREME|nr:hypothetical protein M231_00448 [Tremella mesenterica]